MLAFPKVKWAIAKKKRIRQIRNLSAILLRVYGPGVEDGVLSSFVSAFICDVSRAIDNDDSEKDRKCRLKVSVSGPKGNDKFFALGCVT